MNEKLVSWFEDLLPEIKESGDVESTLLKFASEKNLAPALLEKIGHVYNTAKTVNYLDKAAGEGMGRGDTFVVLDVPEMLSKYTKKTASSAHKFGDNNFTSSDSDKLADLFKADISVLGTDDEFESPEYHEIKLASSKHAEFFDDSLKKANNEVTEQLIFNLTEDNSEYAKSISDSLRSPACEISFEDLEKDANFYFDGGTTTACDYIYKYISELGMHEKRASDAGRKRFVKHTDILEKVALIQDNLNTIQLAQDLKKKFIVKKAATATEIADFLLGIAGERTTPGRRQTSRKSGTQAGGDTYREAGKSTWKKRLAVDALKSPLNVGKQLLPVDKDGWGGGAKAVKGVQGMVKNLVQNHIGIGDGKLNKAQLGADRDEQESRRESLLQELLITDPILSEEDPDTIIDIYNTIKTMSPRLAEDKNVMRVALRSAIQHEGIAPQEIKQFLEAEHDMQKVRNNIDTEEKRDYMLGGIETHKSKPQPRIV